jgi:hypothetical protein
MRYRALKELPQGQQPGDVFEPDTPAMGDLLVEMGAAERVVEPDAPIKGKYKRRDLRVEP